MIRSWKVVAVIFAACAAAALVIAVHRGQANAASKLPVVAGAVDVLPIAEATLPRFAASTGLSLTIASSPDAVAALKAGLVDVALLGKEPDPSDLPQLDDHVVAYDAVCLVVDLRSYNGGEQIDSSMGVLLPMARTNGLKDLSLDDVAALASNAWMQGSDVWSWRADFANYRAVMNPATAAPEPDPANPKYARGVWVRTAIPVRMWWLLPGKFDTQGALFQQIGLNEANLANATNVSFAPHWYDSEEELVSGRWDLNPGEANHVSRNPFFFQAGFLSRRVTLRAIRYGFMVHAVSIDGVDPTGDTGPIYGGQYPLSRRIHVLTRRPAGKVAAEFVAYLASPAGQAQIAQEDFLPAVHHP
jgi:hypothetical protein